MPPNLWWANKIFPDPGKEAYELFYDISSYYVWNLKKLNSFQIINWPLSYSHRLKLKINQRSLKNTPQDFLSNSVHISVHTTYFNIYGLAVIKIKFYLWLKLVINFSVSQVVLGSNYTATKANALGMVGTLGLSKMRFNSPSNSKNVFDSCRIYFAISKCLQ